MLLHTWIAGLNEENFKDAKKYLPERWTTPTSPHSPLLVAPFGAGRRICPGKRFVDLALQLILAKVLLFLLFITFLDSLDLYIYIHTHIHVNNLFPCRLYENLRSSWTKNSICNLNLFSRQKARSPLVSAIVLEIPHRNPQFSFIVTLVTYCYFIFVNNNNNFTCCCK